MTYPSHIDCDSVSCRIKCGRSDIVISHIIFWIRSIHIVSEF